MPKSLIEVMPPKMQQNPEDSSPPVWPNSKTIDGILSGWGLLSEYRQWTLADYGQEGPLPWDGGGFYISGGTGCGKSCLAGAIIRDRMDPAHPESFAHAEEQIVDSGGKPQYQSLWQWPRTAVAWYYALELPRLVMDSWGKRDDTEGEVIKKILRAKIIIIDDLGCEKSSDHTLPVMREVVEKCVNGGIHLIVTSNHTLSELSSRDVRVASRLTRLTPIIMPGKDLRKRSQSKPITIEI